MDLIGLRAPRVSPGNDSDGFFFSDGRLKHLRACENTDGEWRALSFPPAGISLLIKKVVLQRQTRPKQDNRRKARQHVKLLSRFNQGISSTLYYSRSPMMGSRLQAIKRQQNIEALFPEIQSS